ncbi:MAG TPA: hypothetical protein PKM25_04030 [Candidatus Ozemobacteraceae bacterium]|nr:hypothetical protein [Candidatus Ozemobacteraceae bacterium]
MAAESQEPEISRAILTIPARFIQNAVSTKSVAKCVLESCRSSAPGSFGMLMKLAGGEWRLFATPTAVHLVMLLPQTASESESLLGGLCDAIAAGLRNQPPNPAAPSLQELLLASAIGRYAESESKTSLWLDGPLSGALTRLEPRLPSVHFGNATASAPALNFIHFPNGAPAVARILTWEPSTPDAHFSARYIGESFLQLPNFPQGSIAFDIWDLPTRTILALVASAPIHELELRERIIDSFITERSDSGVADPRWSSFASAALQLLNLDRRDLAKSALMAAQATRNNWSPIETTEIGFVKPKTSHTMTILPREEWNRFIFEPGSNLNIAAASISDAPGSKSSMLDAALLIKPSQTARASIISPLRRLIEEDDIPSMQLVENTPDGILISWSMPFSELTPTLTIVRSRLAPFFRVASDHSSEPPGTMALAVIGTIPPYRLLSRIHEALPFIPENDSPAQRLSLETLKRILQADTSGLQELRGKWKICAASQNSLARFLARLAASGFELQSLKEVDTLLNLP